ncbi:MAG TPA: CheR family methyltransferase [Methylophilaceae bacterium]|nr:CheR family methyltransferase [Methylophilaceae bacterium]
MKRSPSKTATSNKHLPKFGVVGIGFSAGGWPALTQLFQRLPPNSGMAFVVVLHLPPHETSSADVILQRSTQMPVKQVTGPTLMEPNAIYVIAPHQLISINDGYLSTRQFERQLGSQVVIDTFFRTLAEAYESRAIAIILSGTGTDGALGVKSIKECGGVTLAQHPSEASFDSMPLAAIATGAVDFILPVAEMPRKLMDIWQNARNMVLPEPDDDESLVVDGIEGKEKHYNQILQDILLLLRNRTGHDFRHYKRATILRRIERRMQVRGVTTLGAYLSLLEADADEHIGLLKDMLIGVTNYFRDREAFDALDKEVLPEIFNSKHGDDQVRVWVPACSTGEEAYTLAMLLDRHASHRPTPPQIQLFASDIDSRAIASARLGSYTASILTDVPEEFSTQYFTKENEQYVIRKTIRDKVLFAEHNLLRDPPFSKLDLISCRNLLIYLNKDAQSHLFDVFHFALNPGGYLFLGSSESAEMASHLFTPVDKKHRIYRVKVLSRSTRYAPSMSSKPLPRTPEALTAKRPSKRQVSFAEIHQRVLAQYAPPSIVINHDYDIVYISDRAGRFLQHTGGEPSRNVLNLVLPELRLELRTAVFQAIQSGKSVEARQVRVSRDNRSYFVNMTVRPFRDESTEADLVLVLFDEVEQTMSEPAENDAESSSNKVLAQLEEELQRTKQQLQETIEHSEISNEDLRASNEELQAINEELRSATEELETSKEELQSLNEELVTVNYELKNKIDETSKVNDDLNNLIASSDIATIFVDRGMRINRYTPRAANIFNIIPTDIGRSLFDITHKLAYPELGDDVKSTFETLRPSEREVRSNDGHYYIVRHLPYRTMEDHIEGAVITFFDITQRREVEERLRVGPDQQALGVLEEGIRTRLTDDMAESLRQISANLDALAQLPDLQPLHEPAAQTIKNIRQAVTAIQLNVLDKLQSFPPKNKT